MKTVAAIVKFTRAKPQAVDTTHISQRPSSIHPMLKANIVKTNDKPQ